jgi:ribonucleoside-diphosphate reductase alpha chain
MSSRVRKRSGGIEQFQLAKVRSALARVMKEVGASDQSMEVATEATANLKKQFRRVAPSHNDVRDVVEDVLLRRKLPEVAHAFMTHQNHHEDLQELRELFGVERSPELSHAAMSLLRQRYLLRNAQGKVVETPERMFHRVAKHVASAEKKNDRKVWEGAFYEAIASLDFLPHSTCLANAGTSMTQLAGSYVLVVPDSLDDIFASMRNAANIFQSGAAVGYSFSALRPAGSRIASSNRVSSGPVSFMEVFDKAAHAVKQGGVQHAPQHAVLRVDHPDIFSFVTKKANGSLEHFQVVAVSNAFMRAVLSNGSYWLRDHKGKKVQQVQARKVYDFLCSNAWDAGDPSLLFLDTMNRGDPLRRMGTVDASTRSGASALPKGEEGVGGSVNLKQMVRREQVDWPKLATTVALAVRFLDNVVTVSSYPTKAIETLSKGNRKIGLGVMGWADMLVSLGLPYDSLEARTLGKKVMTFIKTQAAETSVKLGREKGAFPNMRKSSLKQRRRNATLLSIAPTGSISVIADCSSGIEPLASIAHARQVQGGMKLFESNKVFNDYARYHGFSSKKLLVKVSQRGSVQGMREVPKVMQALFKTSLDLKVEDHIAMQAAFQSQVDNAVVKAVNLPASATVGDVKRAYMLAWKEKCKGINLYRYGSQARQNLYLGREGKKGRHTLVQPEYSGGCLHRTSSF